MVKLHQASCCNLVNTFVIALCGEGGQIENVGDQKKQFVLLCFCKIREREERGCLQLSYPVMKWPSWGIFSEKFVLLVTIFYVFAHCWTRERITRKVTKESALQYSVIVTGRWFYLDSLLCSSLLCWWFLFLSAFHLNIPDTVLVFYRKLTTLI